jgi:hypothetical protein
MHMMEDYLKGTIEKAEKYVLLGMASAVIFFTLSLAEPQPGEIVEWRLLGFPINIAPPLALIASFLAYQFFVVVVYSFILHARDLTSQSNREPKELGFKYPTILTISPLGSAATMLVPGILVGLGCLNVRKYYPVNNTLLIFFALYSIVGGILLFWRNQEILAYRIVEKATKKA